MITENINIAIGETSNERNTALENVKTTLLEAFNNDEKLSTKLSDVLEVKPKKRKNVFWRNLKYCWYRPWKATPMAARFRLLAGIKTPDVAKLILFNDTEVELKKLPAWYDVIRYQLCGFKLTIYDIDDESL